VCVCVCVCVCFILAESVKIQASSVTGGESNNYVNSRRENYRTYYFLDGYIIKGELFEGKTSEEECVHEEMSGS